MKPILCDTCLNCEKEINKREIPVNPSSYYTKTMDEVSWYCRKKGRYATHHDRYYCSDYANKRLTDYVE